MDEDLGAKVPVTRLRRRLSVDAEEATHSPAPSTPTKKRGARLAAKPQLELINEIVTENVPKRTTRKAAAKDAVESEEAPVTPSRRSTRIRSNTSILSETTLTTESPRAKRALRRNSALGSDTESAVTPARQARRTRKDSLSITDKPAGSDNVVVDVVPSTNVEPVTKETENISKNSKANESSDNDVPSTRKSPRLQIKKGSKTDDQTQYDKSVEKSIDNTVNDSPSSIKTHSLALQETKQNTEIEETVNIKLNENRANPATASMVPKYMVKSSSKPISTLNKSTSSLEKMSNDLKNKRNRTKSWTTLSTSLPNVGINADNEGCTPATNKSQTPTKNLTGSGDCLLANDESKNVVGVDVESPNRSINKSKTQLNISTENKENLVSNAKTEFEINKNATLQLFQKSPNLMQPLVLIDDSDSGSVGKASIDIEMDGEDQCVPICDKVANPAVNASPKKTADSCEPMDIDESMPENVTIEDFSDKSDSSKEEIDVPKERKLSNCEEKNITEHKTLNISERKSISIHPDTSKIESTDREENRKNESINTLNNSNKNSLKMDLPFHGKPNDTIDKSNISVSLSGQVANDSESEFKKKAVTSIIKSSISNADDQSTEKLKESLNKSKRKSSMSHSNSEKLINALEDENKDSKNSNKPIRSSSESQNLEKTSNESKSTLVISQLKDVSANDTNYVVSPNISKNELSKTITGPCVQNKKISLNYSTSTPIQQKPTQKLAMQMNTSVISPNIESKNQEREKTPRNNVLKVRTDHESSHEPEQEIPSSVESEDKSEEDDLGFANKKSVKKPPIKKRPAINSSDSSDDESKPATKQVNKKKSVNKSKSKLTVALESSSGSSDDSEDLNVKDESKIIDDEALDAGEDYESGDSQDEKEREHEEENEIVERGETLDSEEDFSNDSDYEKGSFVISSDSEDDELLSSTEDDLSLSHNELTMGANSKKKFNERKQKQQKKASKEMYEARHSLDESCNISKSDVSKSKKTKRQRLESSTLESENEKTEPTKKNRNRLRIDSSQELSVNKSDADESMKKKKNKRLSESVCEDMTINEKELTICNQSINEKIDPLAVTIKQEPKTPMRNFDISTVAINDRIEEVEVISDVSMVQHNDTLDPLQATMAAGDDSSISISDNEEIVQNYDSVLNNLNMHSRKIKSLDTSLNLNKNTKSKNTKDPVIDEFNLTVTQKTSCKKNTNKFSNEATKPAISVGKDSEVADKEDGEMSDSIDMKLLFPEDSNDSEIHASQFKRENNDSEEFIPLKRTEAKTNILGNEDFISSFNESVSKKKNKKHKVSHHEIPSKPDVAEEPCDSDIKIIIDTTGTYGAIDESMTQSCSTKKKKKNKNKSVTIEDSTNVIENITDVDCTDGIAENAVEISFPSEKKKKKHKRDKSFDISTQSIEIISNISQKQSENRKSKSKKMSGCFESEFQNIDNTVTGEMAANISIVSDKNKNKNDLSVNNMSVDEEPIMATQTLSSKKKPKKISMSADDVEPQSQKTELEEVPITSIKSEKKKKKNKHNPEMSQTIVDNAGVESDEAPLEVAYKSEKKGDEADTVTDDAEVTSSGKKKKKNKKKKKDKDMSQTSEKSDANNASTEQDDGAKKRKRTATGNTVTETEDVSITIPTDTLKTSNEKKKRKVHLGDELVAAYDDINEPAEIGSSSKKSKKKKKSKNDDNVEQDEVPHHNTKKRKHRTDDNEELLSKVPKHDSFDSMPISRLPESILSQLEDKPKIKMARAAVIATVPFVVENAVRRRNKPSNYLEQSVYLNDSREQKKSKTSQNKPKVLPFTPTALISDSGYTSKFNINVIPKETQFVAQASNVENFKQAYLDRQRIKKLKTFERCKIKRSHKLSKF